MASGSSKHSLTTPQAWLCTSEARGRAGAGRGTGVHWWPDWRRGSVKRLWGGEQSSSRSILFFSTGSPAHPPPATITWSLAPRRPPACSLLEPPPPSWLSNVQPRVPFTYPCGGSECSTGRLPSLPRRCAARTSRHMDLARGCHLPAVPPQACALACPLRAPQPPRPPPRLPTQRLHLQSTEPAPA